MPLAAVPVTHRNDHERRPLPLAFEWASELKPVLDYHDLIEGLLPKVGAALMFGQPGSGKSFLALDMSFAIGSALHWRGRETAAGLVVYVAAEGASGVRNRIVGLRQVHGVETPSIALISDVIDMQAADGDWRRLGETVDEASRWSGERPALIIIDTLSKTFGAGKENSDDMAGYVANLERLANRFQCCVMAIHHPAKAGEADPRGHSSLRGGLTTMLFVDEVAGQKRVTVAKQKDGIEGLRFPFALQTVEIGRDAKGRPVTTCIIEHVEDAIELPIINKKAQSIARLSPNYKLALKLIGAAIETYGEPVPVEIPGAVINRIMVCRVVSLGQCSDSLISGLRTASDTKPDSARKTFQRARIALQNADLIGVWEDFIWLK
jgi:hypothetical protein